MRTHFLLNTGNGTPSLKWGSTNVYTEDGAGNPVYSWTLMDGIMDAITGAGALPFAEIAFMPQALSTHADPVQDSGVGALDGGCFYPPKDYAKWSNLIKAWAMHENARYPERREQLAVGAVERARHRLLARDLRRLREALRLHRGGACTRCCPNAPLGGPAVASAGGSFLTQFLQHCATGANAVTADRARAST